jgi:predicted permease
MNWWQRLVRRREMEEHLEKELQFHLDEHAADLISRGVESGEARRRARLALGGPEQVREKCRDARSTRWLEDLLQDSRYAARMLRTNPGFAAVAILTLALGSGATTVAFSVVSGVLLKPLPYASPERLVTLHGKTERHGEQWGFSYLNFRDYQRDARNVAWLEAWTYGGGTLSEGGEAEYLRTREISSGIFDLLGVPVEQGRSFLPEEDQPGAGPVILLSHGLWQRRFGGRPDAVGKSVEFGGKAYTVVGIVPAKFHLDQEAVDAYVPIGQNPEPRMHARAANFLHVLGRRNRGVTTSDAAASLGVINQRLADAYPRFNAGRKTVLRPLREDAVADVRPMIWLLLGAVSIVLLIACVNVASLLLARAVSRERELAMRVALGASRGRLARQCLTESAALGLAGGALGVAFAAAGLRPFVALWPDGLPLGGEVQIDWRVMVFATVASLLCGLLFGLAPALRAPARDVEQRLRMGGRTLTGGSRRLHGWFVASEIALAVVLLVAAGVIGKAIVRLSSVDPGFRPKNVMAARVAISPAALDDPEKIRAAWRGLLEGTRSVPGVESAALADIVPMRVGENSLTYWATPAEPPANEQALALSSCVTPDYAKTIGLSLIRGRFLNDDDRLGHPLVVVIDDMLAKHAFGDVDPVGKQLWVPALDAGPLQVVGIVEHVRHWGLASDDYSTVRDELYYPLAQVPDRVTHLFAGFTSIVVRTNVPPLSLLVPLQQALKGATGDQTFYGVVTMEGAVRESLATQRFLLLLFSLFAGAALLLACIGIYGVLAYLTTRRIPEFGVRIALGASSRNVIGMVLRESMATVALGIVAGAIAAVFAGRFLEHSVEGIRHVEPMSFVVMIPLLVAAAFLASLIQALRASRIDPVAALREE